MRKILAILVLLVGLAIAAYVGLFVLFVGGIVQLADGVQADPVIAGDVAWGIVRIVFASSVAGLLAWFSGALAYLLWDDE